MFGVQPAPLEPQVKSAVRVYRRASRSQRNVERSTGSSAEGTRLKGVRACQVKRCGVLAEGT